MVKYKNKENSLVMNLKNMVIMKEIYIIKQKVKEHQKDLIQNLVDQVMDLNYIQMVMDLIKVNLIYIQDLEVINLVVILYHLVQEVKNMVMVMVYMVMHMDQEDMNQIHHMVKDIKLENLLKKMINMKDLVIILMQKMRFQRKKILKHMLVLKNQLKKRKHLIKEIIEMLMQKVQINLHHMLVIIKQIKKHRMLTLKLCIMRI
mmetsp:Transcript_3586/g.4436  ORF Transcript_3586/g.4436 Transcript_3586/m.4436 type:complete len:203 (+) Transcript_3586:1057-1665(+)